MNGIYSFFEALCNNHIEYAEQYATLERTGSIPPFETGR